MSFNWASQVGQCLFSDLLGGSDRAKRKLFLPLSASMCLCDSACGRVYISQQAMNYHMPADLWCIFCVSVFFTQSWIFSFPKHGSKIDGPNLGDSQEEIDCVCDLILSSEGHNLVTNCSYSPCYNSSAHMDSGNTHCHEVWNMDNNVFLFSVALSTAFFSYTSKTNTRAHGIASHWAICRAWLVVSW